MPTPLVNGFEKVSIRDAEAVKRMNKCEKVEQSSPRWQVWYGTGRPILLPPPMMDDLVRKMFLNQIPRQSLVVFTSAGEAYVVLCQFNFLPEILKVVAIKGPEAAFAMISQLAPGS